MRLTVGELARRSGLTVRTLHHYDAIGLLSPSLRSDAGYRLYDRANIERLHRIQALRQLGLSLADIGKALSGTELPLAGLIDRQIAQLDRELAQATHLRQRLRQLRRQLQAGQSPDLAEWLDTLEMMTMYEKYFSPDELKQLPLHHNPDAQVEWGALISDVQAAMDRSAMPGDHDMQILGLRWMRMLQRDTGGKAEFLVRLNTMHEAEPAARARSGITSQLQRFVEQAVVEGRLAIFQHYLKPDEFAFMRANYGTHMHEWAPLIAALRKAMIEGVPTSDANVQALAARWMTLFRAYAGDDPATHARIRGAYANEPDLRSGSFVDRPLLEFVQRTLRGMPEYHR